MGRGGGDEEENSLNEDTNSLCEEREGQNRLEGRGQGRVFKTEALMKDGWAESVEQRRGAGSAERYEWG